MEDEELQVVEEENPQPSSNRRLLYAMTAYAVLAGLAFLRLQGKVLYAVLILFAGLAAKTLIADRAGWRQKDS